ncbi:hypothetical protein [Lysobacter silvisoli]|uniref:Transmembrane protein n=1 Tax=Lysobacter silvisoli TaxID=2293254 RepID=A0A371K1F8_9GAMM|nr:hypothetical protein [Lysobacter silvisoli]RDZ27745.1 hypothetical protein DX914_00785 [Lysobacter silvisoli]
MIVPAYWAEARLQHRSHRRQVTVRRFGWSDSSLADAQAHADARVQEALQRILAGEPLPRREHRVGYGGSEGLPIREEIVERHGDAVITRNSYGALCLNTPDVLFADVDFDAEPGGALSWRGLLAVLVAAIAVGVWKGSFALFLGVLVATVVIATMVVRRLRRRAYQAQGGPEARARARIDAFIAARPDWRLRLYRTPAGFRLMALHRTFAPREAEAAEAFRALGADGRYAAMCVAQNCFRARVSPKPWRIGIARKIVPPTAAWSQEQAQLPARLAWLVDYAQAALGYASCRYVADFGDAPLDPKAEALRELHDLLCRADEALPIA